MDQLHRRFTDEQVKALLGAYCRQVLDRATVEEALGISRARLFVLLKEYRRDPEGFSIAYQRESRARLSPRIEEGIEKGLLLDRSLIDDPTLPIVTYNYSAIRDRLAKQGVTVALSTIIDRAKCLGCYQGQRRTKPHDREVVTTAIGALVQHDASHHRWSPYAEDRWALVTSLDDYSRKILYADFFDKETTWVHIKAAEALMHSYGVPLRYYVDSLRVFRFVQGRDSVWRRHVLQTDQASPQWRQVMNTLGVDVIYALSPQAKGKIERPYRWLQDRIVRTCALEGLSTMEEGRHVLREEVDRYNNHQVHSTTREVPSIRFDKARKEGRSLFRPLTLPKPYAYAGDVFCLREKRVVNGYRRVSLFNHDIEVPRVPLREEVDVHLIPDLARQVLDIRIWWNNQLVRSLAYPLAEFPGVHF